MATKQKQGQPHLSINHHAQFLLVYCPTVLHVNMVPPLLAHLCRHMNGSAATQPAPGSRRTPQAAQQQGSSQRQQQQPAPSISTEQVQQLLQDLGQLLHVRRKELTRMDR